MSADPSSWQVRESTDHAVLAALFLRAALGVRDPVELPQLRGAPHGEEEAPAELAAQWRQYWDMTVEPEAHPADVPLELVPGFDTLVALPMTSEVLRRAAAPFADQTLTFVRLAHDRQGYARWGHSDAAWSTAVREEEKRIGRPAHPFVLRVQVLPFTQRGIWRIGALTVAVSDSLRRDVAAFGRAIRPIVTDLV